ncbi:hypothetical protein AVEN_60257-1 [Araneus ventricosus]|uniref:Uncharacterized protein n=1 Tax=Araneus ventricosus TaxID=182803 RepID=A0A4Y2CZS7_ARAVE|nr:hypothetical protein AVEN_60257-1 [Araneus ventricosus]
MGKVRLLPSGVQGLVPTEAALSSFTLGLGLAEDYYAPSSWWGVGPWWNGRLLDTAISMGDRTLGLGLAED